MKNFFMVNECDCIEDPKIAQKCKESEERRGLKRSSWEVTIPQETHKNLTTSVDINPYQDYENLRSKWTNEEDSFNSKNLPKHSYHDENVKEVNLYDFTKSFDENFEHDKSYKYMLIRVDTWKSVGIINPTENFLPTPQSKCLIDFDKAEEYSSLEFGLIDYDTIFGTRFTTFIKYNSDFFACDERVLFEGILIKFKAFGFKPFYWSKEVIFKETGIKKDRATKIINRFVELGIISTEVRKSKIGNRPQQITYYTPHSDKIIDLVPEIFKGREEIQIVENDLDKYLLPTRGKSMNFLE